MIRTILLLLTLLLTVLGSYWGRHLENVPTSQTDFLHGLSLPFRNLKTAEMSISAQERALLQPDSVLIRRYGSDAALFDVELAVIAGHHKRSVHTPVGWLPT